MVFLILFTRIHPPPPPLLPVSRHQQLWPDIPRTAFFSVNTTPIFPRRIHTKSRRWDSNAETFRTQNFDFNSADDDDDFEDDDSDQWLDILEDFIDGVWIFKVFRSFGWFLPAIISSLLLASGPKAFLMALAIPIGQSALSMLFQTVWGRPKNKTRRRGKSKSEGKRKPPPPPRRGGANYADVDEEEEEYPRGERKKAPGYQTWVAGDGGSGDKKSSGSSASFGGWEELDRRSWSNAAGKRKPLKNKLSRKERRSTTPLFFRLLIAVFPFLGSWTRML